MATVGVVATPVGVRVGVAVGELVGGEVGVRVAVAGAKVAVRVGARVGVLPCWAPPTSVAADPGRAPLPGCGVKVWVTVAVAVWVGILVDVAGGALPTASVGRGGVLASACATGGAVGGATAVTTLPTGNMLRTIKAAVTIAAPRWASRTGFQRRVRLALMNAPCYASAVGEPAGSPA
ncbi:MAG: hypothetical protein IT340_09275 [Chloroflexi bacterium]|nr:hypothetical protein [Chloroflexota bacterium]